MSIEDNKKLACRFWELFHDDGMQLVDEIISDDFVHHSWPWVGPGRDGLKDLVANLTSGFSEYHYDIEDVIAEGDKVVVRLSESGAHTGDLFGMPPTGNRFELTAIHILRIDNGKIVEHWREQDTPWA
jgi:predicted ester cyclase